MRVGWGEVWSGISMGVCMHVCPPIMPFCLCLCAFPFIAPLLMNCQQLLSSTPPSLLSQCTLLAEVNMKCQV